MKTVFTGSRSLPEKQIDPAGAEAVIVMPYTDRAMAERAARLMASRAGCDGLLIAVEDERRDGFIALANRVFAATDSTYFGYVAQDAFPGRQWLALALSTLKDTGGKLLAFNDGKWAGGLAAFGLADRRWAARNTSGGTLFHEGYGSHYADAELTVLAIDQGVYRYNANALLVEVDYEKDGKPVNAQDKAAYQSRAATLFDGRLSNAKLASYVS